jgi:hypothetical protein
MTDLADIMKSLRRMAWDSLPPQRAAVLRARIAGSTTQASIADATGMSQQEVSYILDDIHRLAKHENLTTSTIINTLTGDNALSGDANGQ